VCHTLARERITVMPSKGNPIIKTRVNAELEQEVETTIRRRNLHSDNEPWDTSAFIRAAIKEKIQHMERSRNKGRKKTGVKKMRKGQTSDTKDSLLFEVEAIRAAIGRMRSELRIVAATSEVREELSHAYNALNNLVRLEAFIPEVENSIVALDNEGQELDEGQDEKKG